MKKSILPFFRRSYSDNPFGDTLCALRKVDLFEEKYSKRAPPKISIYHGSIIFFEKGKVQLE